jgi:serine/threonine-protein kinase
MNQFIRNLTVPFKRLLNRFKKILPVVDGEEVNLNDCEISGALYYGSARAVSKGLVKKTGKLLALKHLSPRAGKSAEVRKNCLNSLKREEAFGQIIDHPNIVSIYGIVEHENEFYLLMEFLGDGSLTDVIRKREEYSYRQLIDICYQVSKGLNYMHRQKIVHRDLKPSNILFDGSRPVITDFGFSYSEEIKGLSKIPPRSGTPKYMSPEQTRGWEPTPATDIFSFGIIMYEMFSGEMKISAQDASNRAEKNITSHFLQLQQLNPRVPDDLNTVVMQCLHNSRRSRIGHGLELMRALEPLLEREYKQI